MKNITILMYARILFSDGIIQKRYYLCEYKKYLIVNSFIGINLN